MGGDAASNPANKAKSKKKALTMPAIDAVQASAPFHVEVNHRAGRHAVADEEMDVGSLLMIEHPFVAFPIPRAATAICHRCLKRLDSQNPVDPKKANPYLPRFCTSCKTKDPYCDSKVQNALLPLRVKLPELAKDPKVEMDPTLGHLITLLDLERSGVLGDTAKTQLFNPYKAYGKDNYVHCSAADYDALSSVWEKKDEAWRKKAGAFTRAIHKELKALEESGTLPGYKASSIQQLQADAATAPLHLHQIARDYGLGLFPGLSVFPHSCIPNCFYTIVEGLLYVRAIQPIKKGDALTVSHVGLMEPRAIRQQILSEERFLNCQCPRCVEPLQTSVDKFLEGIWCGAGCSDVMLPLKAGEENDAAAKSWQELVENEEKLRATRIAKAVKKNKHKPAGGKGAKDGKGDADGAEANQNNEDGAEGEEEQTRVIVPPNTLFWKCCNCGFVEPAHNVQGCGPGDTVAKMDRKYKEAMFYLVQLRGVAEMSGRAEPLLEEVLNESVKGRVPPYNHKIVDCLTPLINITAGKKESIKAINYAIKLWETEKDVLGLPTLTQLSCMEVVVEAAETKAKDASSETMKKHLLKKVKAATQQYKLLRQQLLDQ